MLLLDLCLPDSIFTMIKKTNYIYIFPLDSDEKETKVYTLGILSILPLFFAMYEDSYIRNPNIWEQDNRESVYIKGNNIRPFHGDKRK